MRSQDVAELAGVSVRTLRHYHRIGLLPEPVRRPNGYRSYDLATIARLLRIRRLTELGVPLHQVTEMLETTPRRDLLDDIDGRLAAEVDRLQGQRRQIARLRRTGERADVPEGLAELLSLGPSDLAAGVLGEIDQDTLLVIARVIGPDNLNRQALSNLADVLRPWSEDAELAAAAQDFDRLAVDAPPGEVHRVADRLATVLAPMAVSLVRTPTGRALEAAAAGGWPDPAQDSRLNRAQARAMERLLVRLAREGTG